MKINLRVITKKEHIAIKIIKKWHHEVHLAMLITINFHKIANLFLIINQIMLNKNFKKSFQNIKQVF